MTSPFLDTWSIQPPEVLHLLKAGKNYHTQELLAAEEGFFGYAPLCYALLSMMLHQHCPRPEKTILPVWGYLSEPSPTPDHQVTLHLHIPTHQCLTLNTNKWEQAILKEQENPQKPNIDELTKLINAAREGQANEVIFWEITTPMIRGVR